MAYDFPTAPANGTEVTTPAGVTFIWDGVAWSTAPIAFPAVPTDDAPPAGPVDGNLWWDSLGGNLYIYYQDPNSAAWVPATSSVGGGGGGSSYTFGVGLTDTAGVVDLDAASATTIGGMMEPVGAGMFGRTAAGAWTAIPAPVPLVEPIGAGTWGRLETGAWQRSVAVSGDTMTGGLTIAVPGGWSNLTLTHTPTTVSSITAGLTSGAIRWQIAVADNAPEGGGNSGSNFSLFNFDDAGAQIGMPLMISRATGLVNFSGAVQVGGLGIFYTGLGGTDAIGFTYDIAVGAITWWGNGAAVGPVVTGLVAPNYGAPVTFGVDGVGIVGAVWWAGAGYGYWPITMSDRKFKTNIQPVSVDALDIINQLLVHDLVLTPPWEGAVPQHWDCSLIADEVAPLIPAAFIAAHPDEPNGYESLRELPIIATLVKAVQQLSARLTAGGL